VLENTLTNTFFEMKTRLTIQLAVACVAVLVVTAGQVQAGVILQDTSDSSRQIQNFEEIGQSFTAEDSFVKIAFGFVDFNQQNFNDALTVNLYEGNGSGGTLVGSVSQTLTPGLGLPNNIPFPCEFVDFDFSFVSLTVGNAYTALVDAQNSRWGISLNCPATHILAARDISPAFLLTAMQGFALLLFRPFPSQPPSPSSARSA
jgi:hypothetical protein